ncbi:hypothetical protein Leryth_016292 [Lithospermum erythrorhizon]|nr:hypothetical protein Leryth_016292 [Lithospermum erythrorhizon]
MKSFERVANVALAGLSLAPLVVNVDPNLNVILTACLTVFVGCCRSVKPTPPATLLPSIMPFLPKFWNDNLIVWRIPFPYIRSLEFEFTRSQGYCGNSGTFSAHGMLQEALANNVLRLAFASDVLKFKNDILGIEMLSLGSFKTGAILLAGLFVYDIFWVFFTPVMLLFPTSNVARPFSMLGLGDIVIPGIFVALALRFDVSRGKQSQYFKSAFLGYAVGVILTIIVMNWFQAAQPALLYIVPAVIGFLAVHVLWNGEVKQLLEFDESKTTDGEDDKVSKKEE